MTGQTTGLPTDFATGQMTAQTLGGYIERWREAFSGVLAAIAAGSAQFQSFKGAFPTPTQFVSTFGTPTQAVIDAIAAYNEVVMSNRSSASGQMVNGMTGLPSIQFDSTDNGVQVAPPSVQNQTDSLLGQTTGLTLADQMAGARPFAGVPKPLRRQLRRIR
jgi:hypothetical protein